MNMDAFQEVSHSLFMFRKTRRPPKKCQTRVSKGCTQTHLSALSGNAVIFPCDDVKFQDRGTAELSFWASCDPAARRTEASAAGKQKPALLLEIVLSFVIFLDCHSGVRRVSRTSPPPPLAPVPS